MSKSRKQTPEERWTEQEAARIVGKHVSKEKGYALLVVSLIACAMPMILGARMWERIPEIVPSGLIGTDGQDDSIPRWMIAFGLPGLMCLLDAICHGQLLWNQKRMTIPNTPVRLVGRWGFPILSILFCSGMIFQSVGEPPLSMTFTAPCILGLILIILGAHQWDCPKDSRLALRFSARANSEYHWGAAHRFAAVSWMAAGLLLIGVVMITGTVPLWWLAVVIVVLLLPFLYVRQLPDRLK